jgi:hypothetical protein
MLLDFARKVVIEDLLKSIFSRINFLEQALTQGLTFNECKVRILPSAAKVKEI